MVEGAPSNPDYGTDDHGFHVSAKTIFKIGAGVLILMFLAPLISTFLAIISAITNNPISKILGGAASAFANMEKKCKKKNGAKGGYSGFGYFWWCDFVNGLIGGTFLMVLLCWLFKWLGQYPPFNRIPGFRAKPSVSAAADGVADTTNTSSDQVLEDTAEATEDAAGQLEAAGHTLGDGATQSLTIRIANNTLQAPLKGGFKDRAGNEEAQASFERISQDLYRDMEIEMAKLHDTDPDAAEAIDHEYPAEECIGCE